MTQPPNRRLVTEAVLAAETAAREAADATKVNSSTYTAGMALKQDAATLGADVAADETVRAAFERKRALDPRDFGAVGDGVTDDSAAIKALEAAITTGSVVHFPKGSWRFAQQSPAGSAALRISGLSDVTISFEPGAELLMDNLNGSGAGTSHGILVVGAGTGIAIIDAKVRWKTAPTSRSTGDGIRFLGYPSDSAPAVGWTGSTGLLRNVQLINCTTINAPQTGALFMGCSDVRVVNFRVQDSKADGLHFNACRRVNLAGHTADNTGDDGLAFVTYHHDTDVWQGQNGPFNQNGLTTWSNYDSQATGIVVNGGHANGLRIGGAHLLQVTGIAVNGKAVGGIIADAAIIGGSINWAYKASRGVSVANAVIDNCPIGVRAVTQNITSADDESWWRFDARFTGVTVRNASNWSIRTEGNQSAASVIAGLHFSAIKVEGVKIGFSSLRDSSVIGLLYRSTTGGTLIFSGQDLAAANVDAVTALHNLTISGISAHGSSIAFQDINRASIAQVFGSGSNTSGVQFIRCRSLSVGDVRIDDPNRTNDATARGIHFQQVRNIDVAAVVVRTDATQLRSLEIGGGAGGIKAADGLRIEKLVYINTINQTDADTLLQGGADGPANHYARMQFFNGGEASPIWRTQTVGTLPAF